MYTAKYVGLTIFGGMHVWEILTPDGVKVCSIINHDKNTSEVETLLSHLNSSF